MFISFNAIKSGKLTLESVPIEYKVQVEAKLNEGE